MLILVSNDDGIDSPGILALAKVLRKIPKAKVVVVAPDREQSASSHALTLQKPLRIEKKSDAMFAVDGTPSDAVMLAVNSILKKKPDIVVSGINRGANLAEDVHYSGTVAAALEGAIMGVPAVAVSLAPGPRDAKKKEEFHFDCAAFYAKRVVQNVLTHGLSPGLALNVNVPNVPRSKIKGVEVATLGKHSYGGIIVEKMDPRGRSYYWIGGDPYAFEDKPHSDCNAYLQSKVSVTPIKVDLTDYEFLESMRSWTW